MHNLLISIILLIGTATPGAVAASAAQPSTQPLLDERAPVYLALGDSIAVGDGASAPARTAYVPLVHEALRDSIPCQPGESFPCPELQLLNLANGFATTTSLREDQLPTALKIIERRNTDDDSNNDVVAITVDIGGFDAMARLFQVCADGISPPCGEAVDQTLSMIGQNLTATLTQLRDATGPYTRIAIMTYYNSLLACTFRDAADSAEMILEGVPAFTPGLNGVIRKAAGRADVEVADTFDRLGADDLAGGIDCLHPNDSGHAKIAQAFMSVLALSPNGDPDLSRIHGGIRVTAPVRSGRDQRFGTVRHPDYRC